MEVGHFYVTKDHGLVRLVDLSISADIDSVIPNLWRTTRFCVYSNYFQRINYCENNLQIEKEIDISELAKVEKLKKLHYMYMRNEALKCTKMKRTDQKLVIGESFVYFSFKCNEFTIKDSGKIEPGYRWFNKGSIYINKTESDIIEEHHSTFMYNLKEMYDNLIKF